MAIAINGSGTVTGISVGGLPDGIVDAGTLASNSVEEAKIAGNAVVNAKIAENAVSSYSLATNAVATANIADDAVTSPKRGPGAILQVVSTHSDTLVTTSGSTESALLNISIQPAHVNNKILLMTSLCSYQDPGASNAYVTFKLYRGDLTGTNIFKNFGGSSEDDHNYESFGMIFADSPSTTSATTYTVGFSRGSGHTNTVSTDNSTYSLIAMEIEA